MPTVLIPPRATHVQVRRRWERLIWIIDMLAYLFIAVAGLDVMLHPSGYLVEVVPSSAIITGWSIMLMIGGVGAFAGRLSRIWAIEYTANVLAGWGATLYLLVLMPAVFVGELVGTFAITIITIGFMVRRYAELRIFINEPGLDSFRSRLDAVIRRRTGNVVPREYH